MQIDVEDDGAPIVTNSLHVTSRHEIDEPGGDTPADDERRATRILASGLDHDAQLSMPAQGTEADEVVGALVQRPQNAMGTDSGSRHRRARCPLT